MTRRCSHCSNNGHNSRTCPTRGGGSGGGGAAGSGGVRIFGVRLVEGSAMKKSASMSCLSHYTSLAAAQGASPNPGDSPSSDLVGDHAEAAGYASDDPSNHGSCSSGRRGERKKGTPWTEEEHRMFLVGLQKLGKGDWRGIARNFVVSRTPTQVASHAQKYFIRQTNATRRKRRSSLFDMVPDMHVDNVPEQFLVRSPSEPEIANALPSLELTLEREAAPEDPAMDKPPSELNESISCINSPTTLPPFYPAYVPVTYPYWHSLVCLPPKEAITGEAHEVFRPTPVLPKDTSHELVGMSKLSIGEAANSRIEPSALSSKLLGSSSSRQSAFHVNPAAAESDLRQSLGGNGVHVA